MERASLRAVIILGLLVTLVGGTGIFAVFSDRATGGVNSATSAERAMAADLKIASALIFPDNTALSCASAATAAFEDDITDAQFVLGTIYPGTTYENRWLCLQNAGSSRLFVTASAIDLTDIEADCTGDEAAAGDTDCGVGAGELSPLVGVRIAVVDCADYATEAAPGALIALPSYTSVALGSATGLQLDPGQVACLGLHFAYIAEVTETQLQVAQSDTVTWRFAFDGTAG
jgi:hypothetical protein